MVEHAPRSTRLLRTEVWCALGFVVLFVGAFPPIGVWWLGYWALLPISWCAWTTPRPVRTAMVFGLASALGFAFLHRWLIDVTMLGYPLMSLLLGLFHSVFVLALARARRRRVPIWLAAPMCWVGLEFFRGQLAFDGYPWYQLGQTTMRTLGWERPSSIGYLASVFGSYGVSLLIATICVPLLLCVLKHRLSKKLIRGVIGSCAVLVVLSAVGAILARPGGDIDQQPTLRVGIVQTNLPQDNKLGWSPQQRADDFASFVELTRGFSNFPSRRDVIVWPETMYPGLALEPDALAALADVPKEYEVLHMLGEQMRDRMIALQQEIGIPMLIGAEAYDAFRVNATAFDDESLALFEWNARYNSVLMLNQGAVQETRYNKLQLTPFGEVMPYISNWNWLEQLLLDFGAGGMSFDLDAGQDAVALSIPVGRQEVRVAPLVCFEATMPNIARKQVIQHGERVADVLLHATNDGWFGRFAGGREMHALIARLRSIELGTPVVRVANTGISCAFDDIGRRLPMRIQTMNENATGESFFVPANVEAIATVDVPLPRRITFSSRIGESLGWVCLLGLVACVVGRSPKPMHETETQPASSEPES